MSKRKYRDIDEKINDKEDEHIKRQKEEDTRLVLSSVMRPYLIWQGPALPRGIRLQRCLPHYEDVLMRVVLCLPVEMINLITDYVFRRDDVAWYDVEDYVPTDALQDSNGRMIIKPDDTRRIHGLVVKGTRMTSGYRMQSRDCEEDLSLHIQSKGLYVNQDLYMGMETSFNPHGALHLYQGFEYSDYDTTLRFYDKGRELYQNRVCFLQPNSSYEHKDEDDIREMFRDPEIRLDLFDNHIHGIYEEEDTRFVYIGNSLITDTGLLYDGQGELRCDRSRRYKILFKGTFVRGKKQGDECKEWEPKSNETYTGPFHDDQRHGIGTIETVDHQHYRVRYEHGALIERQLLKS